MELKDGITLRRAVRDYTAAAVDRKRVEALLALAVLAPSARNRQPWAFAVLDDRSRIDDYALRAQQHLLDTVSAAELGELRAELLAPGFSIFYRAPVLLLVLAQSAASQDVEDCCLAAQTLMLAARDAGLGTCWIGLGRPWLNLPSTLAELGLPAGCHVVAPIVLGHPARWPEPHGRKPPEIRWLA
jgi:nitroreductase